MGTKDFEGGWLVVKEQQLSRRERKAPTCSDRSWILVGFLREGEYG